ncbi:MAG: RdgB/HAM1 family non-canonical purine NTP pyrophosphatase [Salinisphaera sp.]|jgi:XTP/dITP diphosphohydrolase|nr:RdgB/HAM1 family non-canonical purine NTP pyrophosphatase [Salinisphaera sp.]
MAERWILASGNAGKLAEMSALLGTLDIELVAQSDYGVSDAVEDGVAFIDNALIKARHAAAITCLPAIADDSGLAVDALGGAPGIYSARYAGVHGNDKANNEKLLAALANTPDEERGAAFHCCLVATISPTDPAPMTAHGVWRGKILHTPRGSGGFGYDPLFWIASEQASAGELSASRKNAISHRGRAMKLLLDQLRARR